MPTRRQILHLLAAAPLGYAAAACTSSPRASAGSSRRLYVGTYTDGASEGIYHVRMDSESGTLEIVETIGGIDNPSYLALDPQRQHLYAVGETTSFEGMESGSVHAFTVDANGSLQKLNEQPSHGGAPCYVSVTPDGRHVLVANYVGGNVSIYPVESDGRLGAASDTVQHEGSGVNEQRQEAPHAHYIRTDPEGTHILAVDLGIDQVVVYRRNGDRLERTGHADLAPGAGPRHLAFHPDGDRAFVINELDSTLTAFTYADGTLTPIETVSTLPDDYAGENSCADVHVSADGRFVYGSNRGHNSIVVLAVHPENGSLETVQHVATGGEWPRNFAIDPTGRFLLAANQHTDNIVVFEIDAATGRLSPTGDELAVPSPVCVLFAS